MRNNLDTLEILIPEPQKTICVICSWGSVLSKVLKFPKIRMVWHGIFRPFWSQLVDLRLLLMKVLTKPVVC